MLKVRDEMKTLLDFKVGDGERLYLWQDPWRGMGTLMDFLPRRVTMDSGLPYDSRVSAIVNGEEWRWPTINHYWMEDIIRQMPQDGPNARREDRITWRLENNGLFSTKSYLRHVMRGDKARWAKIVWYPNHVPRHSFIMWLVFREALRTKDKLLRFMQVPPQCVLCNSHMETTSHLLWECQFSKQVWAQVMEGARVRVPTCPWPRFVEWMCTHWRKRRPWERMCCRLIGAIVYELWQERNRRVFNEGARTKNELVVRILSEVRLAIMGLKRGDSLQERYIRRVWKID